MEIMIQQLWCYTFVARYGKVISRVRTCMPRYNGTFGGIQVIDKASCISRDVEHFEVRHKKWACPGHT